MKDFFSMSLSDRAARLRAGNLTAQDLAEAAIEWHERSDRSFGAYNHWDPERLRRQARAADAALAAGIDGGPLHGIPVSVKDLFAVHGYPTCAGTPRPLPARWMIEGPVVRALRRQLAPVTGKTHTVEFAFGGLGVNRHWETPRNPWDAHAHRVPGGSSSGAGVSLCAGSAHLALGTDTAGSVRIPASMTGVVGLKTGIGRWPMAGIVPLSPTLDSVGLLARTVADAAYAFTALDAGLTAGGAEPVAARDLATVRIGIAGGLFWDDCSPGIAEGVQAALDTLAAGGARLVEQPLPDAERVDALFRKGSVQAVELFVFLKNELPGWLQSLDPTVAQRMADAATLPASDYLERLACIRRCSARADEALRGVDVVACPTVAITPPTLAEIEALDAYRRANLLALRNTAIVSHLGLCALTLPVALDAAGMPLGLQLIGRHGRERELLAVALACERCLGSGRERLGRAPGLVA